MAVITTTKKDLVAAVVEKLNCSQQAASKMVDSMFVALREKLIAGDRIEIRGFGTLTVKDSQARPKARNPRTGEIIDVPARRKAVFKPGKELREALKKS